MSLPSDISVCVPAAALLLVLRRGAVRPLLILVAVGWAGLVPQSAFVLPPSPAIFEQAGGAQSDRVTRPDRITRPTSEPYKGDLSIFENPGREERLQIDRVMDLLRIKEGSGVADIGAGSGWFTVRAARRIGPTGTVFAVEINPDYLKHIEGRANLEHLGNIRTILGKEDDPALPAQCVDAVLILKTYHEIAQPILLLARLRAAMRPGALLGIIDRNGNGNDHGIDSKTVIGEAGRAGFTLLNQYDFVKPDGMDYFLVLKQRRRTGDSPHP